MRKVISPQADASITPCNTGKMGSRKPLWLAIAALPLREYELAALHVLLAETKPSTSGAVGFAQVSGPLANIWSPKSSNRRRSLRLSRDPVKR